MAKKKNVKQLFSDVILRVRMPNHQRIDMTGWTIRFRLLDADQNVVIEKQSPLSITIDGDEAEMILLDSETSGLEGEHEVVVKRIDAPNPEVLVPKSPNVQEIWDFNPLPGE